MIIVLRCPGIYDALIECSAFVNWRKIDIGNEPVLLLAFYSEQTIIQ